MKNLILLTFLAIIVLPFLACKNSPAEKDHQKHNMSGMSEQSAVKDVAGKELKTTAVSFRQVDPTAFKKLNELFADYIAIKNALAADNSKEAAEGAKALTANMKKLDKSFLTAEQKDYYDHLEAPIEEYALQIESNASNIKTQRLVFSELSENTYEMVKAFGAGKPVYQVHCSMAKNNEGANWVSESKEISNPYFGAEMANCGTVEEEIK